MKNYFADTNFFLRFILQDNQAQAKKVEDYLNQAEQEEIKITYLVAVIIEMEVVLRKVYRLSRDQIAKQLLVLVKTPYLIIEDRQIWIQTFGLFSKYNLALLDLFIFEKAKVNEAEVLTFDQKLAKLK